MAADLRETQLALMEDVLAEMQDSMAGGYRQIAYDLAIANAEKRFREEMSFDCRPDKTRDGCIRHFLEDHLRKGIASPTSSSCPTTSLALSWSTPPPVPQVQA